MRGSRGRGRVRAAARAPLGGRVGRGEMPTASRRARRLPPVARWPGRRRRRGRRAPPRRPHGAARSSRWSTRRASTRARDGATAPTSPRATATRACAAAARARRRWRSAGRGRARPSPYVASSRARPRRAPARGRRAAAARARRGRRHCMAATPPTPRAAAPLPPLRRLPPPVRRALGARVGVPAAVALGRPGAPGCGAGPAKAGDVDRAHVRDAPRHPSR